MARWTEVLEAARVEILGYAQEAGLSFPEVIFEVLESHQVNEVAAYGGFPTRYPHWKFGMQYDQLNKSYTYGLSKIYEMVINTDPVYAYLMDSNNLIDQKLVMAHVYGHADFFTHNAYFAHTDRKMMDRAANHSVRVSRFMDRHGVETVEGFVDCCLSLDNLVDYQATLRGAASSIAKPLEDDEDIPPGKLPSKGYMDRYINPPEFIAERAESARGRRERERNYPVEPVDDVLLFLLANAPLERWQQEILAMVRQEAYYFVPQGQTKIMNEGWATFWHSRIMTGRVVSGAELVDYADHHSGTVAMGPGQLNPYKVGLELFRDIERRWDEAEGEGAGTEKIFEVRRLYNDVNFLDTFLTEEFCADQRLFTFRYNPKKQDYEIASRDFATIKQQILFQLTRLGTPWIQVADANAENRGELLLVHRHEGVDLEPRYTEATLKNLATVWTRPVQLQTVVDGKAVRFRHDGEKLEGRETGD